MKNHDLPAPTICAKTGVEGASAPIVAAIPPETPIIPNALPKRAVGCVESPANAPTQQSEDAR